MKTIFKPLFIRGLVIVLFFNCEPVLAQKFSLQFGAGLGSTLIKNRNANIKGRMMINLGGYYNLNKQLALGLEFGSAGSFVNSLGGNVNEDVFDPMSNTITIDVSNMKSNTVLGKVKYYFINSKKWIKPFAELELALILIMKKYLIFPVS